MRILVVSDLHYRLPHYDWLLRAAADVDVVALVGDLADVVSPVPIDVQSVVLAKYLGLAGRAGRSSSRRRATTTSTAPGPTASRSRAGSGGRTTDACTSTARASTSTAPASPSARGGTVRRPATPWAPSSPRRPSTGPSAGSGSTTHPRPAPSLCRDGRREFPDHELAAWIEEHQPDVVLCGHIHQAPWVDGGSWHDRLGEHLGLQRRASRSGRSRRTSPSTPTRARPTGSGSSTRRRSASTD